MGFEQSSPKRYFLTKNKNMSEVAVCPRSFQKVKIGTIISIITTFATLVFTVGILYSQIKENSKDIEKMESNVGSVPVIQSEITTIKTDVATIKEDIKTLLVNSK